MSFSYEIYNHSNLGNQVDLLREHVVKENTTAKELHAKRNRPGKCLGSSKETVQLSLNLLEIIHHGLKDSSLKGWEMALAGLKERISQTSVPAELPLQPVCDFLINRLKG